VSGLAPNRSADDIPATRSAESAFAGWILCIVAGPDRLHAARCQRFFVATVLATLLGQPALAAPPVLNGSVQYETFAYPEADAQSPRWENFFAASLRSHGQLSSALSWQFEARAVADDVEFTAGAYALRNATRRRPYLSLITALLDYRPSPALRVSVGKQIVNWSGFDEIQPANLMTPRDESDVFRRVELGIPGVSLHYGSADVFAELVVVPLAITPSRLPQGRWNIATTIADQLGGTLVERQELPPVRLDETQAGARVGTHWGRLEASVLGYVGRDTAAEFVPGPFLFTVVNGRPTPTAQIIDYFPRLRAGGITASYPLGDRALLRVESVYYNSPDRNRDDFLHSVAGIEYDLDDWRIVASYFRDDQTVNADPRPLTEPDLKPSTVPVTNKGERRFFQSFIFGEVRYDAGRRLRGQFRFGYDANGEFLIIQPQISYRLWGTLWVALHGEIIQANRSSYTHNKTSYFDAIRHEDRLGTRLEYDF
jgi:hypothetical protein